RGRRPDAWRWCAWRRRPCTRRPTCWGPSSPTPPPPSSPRSGTPSALLALSPNFDNVPRHPNRRGRHP
ncbi:unnamed protein product, partial [Heterosigma akashiwo]